MAQLTSLQRMQETSKTYTKLQEQINRGVFPLNTLPLLAKMQVAEYPQYNNFDKWATCIVTKQIVTKSGLCFDRGDIALCKESYGDELFDDGLDMDIWSFRQGHCVLTSGDHVEIIGMG